MIARDLQTRSTRPYRFWPLPKSGENSAFFFAGRYENTATVRLRELHGEDAWDHGENDVTTRTRQLLSSFDAPCQ